MMSICNDIPVGVAFAEGCTTTFIRCTSTGPVVFSCPSSLVFDMANDRCDMQNAVASCNGAMGNSSSNVTGAMPIALPG
jgi:hypothetical protein